jgi:hypothetical protein
VNAVSQHNGSVNENRGSEQSDWHCQVGQKFADQLKVAAYHIAAFGPQNRAFDQSTKPGQFRQTDPILPQLEPGISLSSRKTFWRSR